MQNRVTARIRNFGQCLPIPKFRRRSRSPSLAPSSSSNEKTSSATAVTPGAGILSTTNTHPASGPPAPSPAFPSSTAAGATSTGLATPTNGTRALWGRAAPLLTFPQRRPVPTTLPQTLSPLEIRQRTAELLKDRLKPEELEKIKWDETTPEQAKAVVREVQKSLEGKPENTGKMHKTLQYINKYAKIVDVAIQHQPRITALVWAGMRTIIQVSDQLLLLNHYLSGPYLYDH